MEDERCGGISWSSVEELCDKGKLRPRFAAALGLNPDSQAAPPSSGEGTLGAAAGQGPGAGGAAPPREPQPFRRRAGTRGRSSVGRAAAAAISWAGPPVGLRAALRRSPLAMAAAQVQLTVEDVTISFSREEWEVLAEWQKELYREVMKENCASLISLGYHFGSPAILSQIDPEEEPGLSDQLDLKGKESPACEYALGVQLEVERHDEGYDVSLEQVSILPGDSREQALQASVKAEDCPSESSVSKQNKRLPTTLALSSLSDRKSAPIPNPSGRDKRKRTQREKHVSKHADPDRHQLTRAEWSRVCAEYGKCFAQKRDLAVRLRVHTGEKRFKCTKCKKCFAQKQQLLRHQETHVTKPLCLCRERGRHFQAIRDLRRHQITHARKTPVSVIMVPKFTFPVVRYNKTSQEA
ncbi:zinc finger protein 69-like [Mauremys mutica]|uniref:zinc finger protein 69-like n=1 Tax=Mauremys mutica TaxID=74926 RepID=UPI001D16CE0C|nr:zinc finger protein 69-like [Mauremys mutica]